MEPTANYHKPLGEYLIRMGRTVVLVSGVTVKHNRESLDGRWDKNDDKDSANAADLISQGKCLYYEYPTAALRGLRGVGLVEAAIEETRTELPGSNSESADCAVLSRAG